MCMYRTGENSLKSSLCGKNPVTLADHNAVCARDGYGG